MEDKTEMFWMVWGDGRAAPTKKHGSFQEARLEAERLARLNPACTFHVLTCVGSCSVVQVEWRYATTVSARWLS